MNKFATQRLRLGTSQSSFHQSSQSGDKDVIDHDHVFERQQSLDDAIHLSVKDHVNKLETILFNLKEDLQLSKKDLNFIRDDLSRIQIDSMKSDQIYTQYVCDEINRLQSDLRKSAQSDMNQIDSMTMQIYQLKIDREELEQNIGLIDLRTISCENDVGFKRVYD